MALLIKATQAATERANSELAGITEGHFSMTYTNPASSCDMVSTIAFSKLNSNMVQLDAKTARREFISKGHREALQISKKKNIQGKTVKGVLIKLATRRKLDNLSRKQKFNTTVLGKPLKVRRKCFQKKNNDLDCTDDPDDPEELITVEDRSNNEQGTEVGTTQIDVNMGFSDDVDEIILDENNSFDEENPPQRLMYEQKKADSETLLQINDNTTSPIKPSVAVSNVNFSAGPSRECTSNKKKQPISK